ncbi:hypothetical protein OG978_13620 [Streptomyces sp. NBC_01591]|uniref:hypothetical protein n=1 Tax=Streptomyces sp. NBC_01591 TaxID=2975888 RepID=UPI002DDBB448|nr:hypothetical protein [Streptomyces sp. NBC_01591]WSD68352.1 hypothetical protein OG978_13620 [Streptomyces sp. NBC_01591]
MHPSSLRPTAWPRSARYPYVSGWLLLVLAVAEVLQGRITSFTVLATLALAVLPLLERRREPRIGFLVLAGSTVGQPARHYGIWPFCPAWAVVRPCGGERSAIAAAMADRLVDFQVSAAGRQRGHSRGQVRGEVEAPQLTPGDRVESDETCR